MSEQSEVDSFRHALVMLGNYINLERAAKERHAARGHKDGLFRDCGNWSCCELRDALQKVAEASK